VTSPRVGGGDAAEHRIMHSHAERGHEMRDLLTFAARYQGFCYEQYTI